MYFYAIRCLDCGCIHGWIDHPLVKKVTQHDRMPMEDVWNCPQCSREHRTHDGGFFGQMQKRWEEVRSEEELAEDEHVMLGDGTWAIVRRGRIMLNRQE